MKKMRRIVDEVTIAKKMDTCCGGQDEGGGIGAHFIFSIFFFVFHFHYI